MRVILYTPDYNSPGSCGHLATLAMSEGLTKLGIEHDVRRTRHWDRDGNELADVCIVNGWWKAFIENRHITNRNVVIRAQQAAGKPPWCIERAFLLDREVYSAISIGGFCSNGGNFRADGMPSDRWKSFGLELETWKTGGNHILLAAQVPWDAQVQGNHGAWIEATVRELRQHTDREILFRGHPKAWRQGNPYGALSRETLDEMRLSVPIHQSPDTTFEADVGGAHAVVCYNSNVATLATVAGYPVFTGAPCLADPIACRDLSLIETPPQRDRDQWAWDLAYRQWHVDEFREAKPWLHLTR